MSDWLNVLLGTIAFLIIVLGAMILLRLLVELVVTTRYRRRQIRLAKLVQLDHATHCADESKVCAARLLALLPPAQRQNYLAHGYYEYEGEHYCWRVHCKGVWAVAVRAKDSKLGWAGACVYPLAAASIRNWVGHPSGMGHGGYPALGTIFLLWLKADDRRVKRIANVIGATF